MRKLLFVPLAILAFCACATHLTKEARLVDEIRTPYIGADCEKIGNRNEFENDTNDDVGSAKAKIKNYAASVGGNYVYFYDVRKTGTFMVTPTTASVSGEVYRCNQDSPKEIQKCMTGNMPSCEKMTDLGSEKNDVKLYVESLSSACRFGNQKACQGGETFKENLKKSKELCLNKSDKHSCAQYAKTQGRLGNENEARVYALEACKLGHKEVCLFLDSLKMSDSQREEARKASLEAEKVRAVSRVAAAQEEQARQAAAARLFEASKNLYQTPEQSSQPKKTPVQCRTRYFNEQYITDCE